MADDRMLRATRVVAALVVPFLWAAFAILWFWPRRTGDWFAWPIQPDLTSAWIGSAYLGGSWFLLRTAVGRRWSAFHVGFPAITSFTWLMLLATALHWERFAHGTAGFAIWLGLYLVTPVLVPWLWWRNRRTDPGVSEPGAPRVPGPVRIAASLVGLLALTTTLATFVSPPVLIDVWPWRLTPLTARVLAGWFAVLGAGALGMAADPRWRAWQPFLQAIVLGHVFVFAAVVRSPGDFTSSPWNWYTALAGAGVAAIVVLMVWMARRRCGAQSVDSTP